MMEVFTVVLSTRLRRRIFQARGIAERFLEILTVRISEINASVVSCDFLDYGIILTVRNFGDLPVSDIVRYVRIWTSKPLRSEFQELWRMPSLWSVDFLYKNGCRSDMSEEEILAYFNSRKKR